MVYHVNLLSDIHANGAALDAVLKDSKDMPNSAYWFLGDALGRGPEPLGALMTLTRLYNKQTAEDQRCWLAGNHDLMVTGKIGTDFFMMNGDTRGTTGGMGVSATAVANQHKKALKFRPREASWLASLPTHRRIGDFLYMAHGDYHFNDDGTISEIHTHSQYVFEENLHLTMRNLIQHADPLPRLILLGHTHTVGIWQWNTDSHSLITYDQAMVELDDIARYPAIINPGSIGFPRNGGCPTYIHLELSSDMMTFDALRAEIKTVRYDWKDNEIPENYPQRYIREMQACQKGRE